MKLALLGGVGIPRTSITVPAKPREIPGEKLHWIDPPIGQLLGHPPSARLRSWVIAGPIGSFDKDLLIARPDVRQKQRD